MLNWKKDVEGSNNGAYQGIMSAHD